MQSCGRTTPFTVDSGTGVCAAGGGWASVYRWIHRRVWRRTSQHRHIVSPVSLSVRGASGCQGEIVLFNFLLIGCIRSLSFGNTGFWVTGSLAASSPCRLGRHVRRFEVGPTICPVDWRPVESAGEQQIGIVLWGVI